MIKPDISSITNGLTNYVMLVDENNLSEAFVKQRLKAEDLFLNKINEETSCKAYAPGKWTLKELLQHMIDSERIFAYRALCFARKESKSQPGFDENDYAAASDANRRSWKALCEEFFSVRKTTELLFESFTETMLHQAGRKDSEEYSPIYIGYAIVGHCTHHFKIIEERYLALK